MDSGITGRIGRGTDYKNYVNLEISHAHFFNPNNAVYPFW